MENEVSKTGKNLARAQISHFLQSGQWAQFQKAVGRHIFEIDAQNGPVFAIEHRLPMVGGYFYVPRWPKSAGSNQESAVRKIQNMIDISKTNNSSWIRIEPENDKMLQLVKKNVDYKIKKAPHDMQPRENFVIDISGNEDALLAEMKSKTRYNIRLAEKQGVKIVTSDKRQGTDEKYMAEFLKLTKEMALRQGIKTHPEEYYRKMIENLPDETLKIYAAEYGGKIIAANLVLFYGNVATYLHGASGNEHRNVMAPHLLQWRAILDAKDKAYVYYDFGGVKTMIDKQGTVNKKNDWQGITKFKLGFSPNTNPVVFPGSYDIVINYWRYALYRILQYVKALMRKIIK